MEKDRIKINISHILEEYKNGALYLKKPQVKLLNSLSKYDLKEYARISKQKLSYIQNRLEEIFKYAESKGLAPANGLFKAIPNNQTMKNLSSYYSIDPDTGETKLRGYWIKGEPNQINIEDIAEYFNQSIIPVEPKKFKGNNRNDCITLYTLTDYHLGMMAWEEEGGQNWNLERAEKMFIAWLEQSLHYAEDTEEAIFAQIGDFLHFDSMLPVTPASKHIVDSSARYGQLVRLGIQLIKTAIDKMLEKHNKVRVILAEGNHDESSSIWFREAFNTLYQNEPRVVIDTEAKPFYGQQFGNNALFFHHGHKVKMNGIAPVVANLYPKLHGDTEHRFVFMGHYHHDKVEEGNGYKVMQLRTLAPNDAYSIRGGWKSLQDAKIFTFHKDYGLISQITLPFNLLNKLC